MNNLPLADFTIYAATYGVAIDGCDDCSGVGGILTGEMQGDEHMIGWVEFLDTCASCINNGLCAGCMQPLALSFDQSALPVITTTYKQRNGTGWVDVTFTTDAYEDALSSMPFDGFVCLVCGWVYDAERASNAKYDGYDADGYGFDDRTFDDSDETREDYEDRTNDDSDHGYGSTYW